MTIYYLYVKTHNQTGLKYLGQTKDNPFKYKGSGLHWKRHLQKHGNDVTTEIVGAFDTRDDLKIASSFWSKHFNIVESKEWANLVPETGNDGAFSKAWNKGIKRPTGKPSWNAGKKCPQISAALKGKSISKPPGFGEKIRQARLGKKLSEETKRKISLNHHNVSGTNNPNHSSRRQYRIKPIEV